MAKKSKKPRNLKAAKKLERQRPLDKPSISDIHFTKQTDASSNTLYGSSTPPAKP